MQKTTSKFSNFLTVLGISVLAFFLRISSSIYGMLKSENEVYLGVTSVVDIGDIWVYLADMMMGKKGSFLLVKEFGLDPQEKFFIRLPYLFLGHISRVLALSVETVYLLASLILTLIFGWLVFCFSKYFIKEKKWQFLAVLLVFFSGPLFPVLVPESVTFLSLAKPHFLLCQICLVLIFGLFLGYPESTRKVKSLFLMVLVSFVLSLSHVFLNWVIIAVLFFWSVFLFFKNQEMPALVPFAVLVLAALPMTVYLFWLRQTSSFFAYWLQSNILRNPGLLTILVAFIFWHPFFILAAQNKRQNKKLIFLFIWWSVQFLFYLLPVSWGLRFLEGWWISCCFLAAIGFGNFYTHVLKPGTSAWRFWRIFGIVTLVMFFFLSNLGILLIEFKVIDFYQSKVPYFATFKEAEAWDFLAPKCNFNKIIFTDAVRGAYLPGKTGCRANLGYSHLTYDYMKRLVEVKKIIDGEKNPDDLKYYFAQNPIDYVFLSKENAQQAKLSKVDNLKLVFDTREIVIYQKRVE